MKKILFGLALLTTLFCTTNATVSYAAPYIVAESTATEKSRVSYLLKGTDGKMYNLYIIGENEKFYGSNAPWRKTENDQIFGATSYWAYISGLNESNAILQDINLFGKKTPGFPEYINRTDPTYTGGTYVIKGMQGQPDILVSAKQPTGSAVTYRFFIIKNGTLCPMKIIDDTNQETMTNLVGIRRVPYRKDDGTYAIPWFRRGGFTRNGAKIPSANFMSVYMADFTNSLLIHAYTYEE